MIKKFIAIFGVLIFLSGCYYLEPQVESLTQKERYCSALRQGYGMPAFSSANYGSPRGNQNVDAAAATQRSEPSNIFYENNCK